MTATDEIPGWNEAERRVRTYPALRDSHAQLLKALRCVPPWYRYSSDARAQFDRWWNRFGKPAIAQAKELTP